MHSSGGNKAFHNREAKMKRIRDTRKEIVKGGKTYTVHKYENARGARRWCVDCDGVEIKHDFSTRTIAMNYIDVYVRG
jgi:hypothetical protein